MYAESMRLSPRWAAEYRGFWDLPEDFDYDVATPTVAVAARRAGQARPRRRRRRVPRRIGPAARRGRRARRDAAGTLDVETLAALLDEKLSRREVKDIQSGYKDADRFEKWLAVLAAAASPTRTRSCCPRARG